MDLETELWGGKYGLGMWAIGGIEGYLLGRRGGTADGKGRGGGFRRRGGHGEGGGDQAGGLRSVFHDGVGCV